MKINYFYLIALMSLMLSSQLLSGQDILSSPDFKGDVSRSTAVFECPPGNVFCYIPENSDNGWTSDLDAGFQSFQSFSGASGPFSIVMVWAIHTSVPSDRELLVEVFEAGATPGTLVSSTTVTVTPVATGEQVIGFDTYTYTIDIPSTNITEGWITVAATAGGTPTFFWLNTYASPSFPALQGTNTLLSGLAMSLSAPPPPIPLSNWALALFGFLVISFLFIKLRR